MIKIKLPLIKLAKKRKDKIPTEYVNKKSKSKIKISNFVTNIKNKISPFAIKFKEKILTIWYWIKIRTSRRLVYSILLILIVAYISLTITLSYQILANYRQDNFARKAIKFFPIPVAYIGNNFIFAGDYFARLALIEKYNTVSDQSNQDKELITQDIIQKIIFTESLRQIAYKNKIKLTQKEIDSEYESIISTLPDPSKAPEEIMNLYNLTVPEFKKFVSEVAIENKVLSEKLVSYNLAHILITDEKTANEVLGKAKAGDDFGELAKKYSEDKYTRDSGGELGFVDRDTANQGLGKDFDDMAFSIPENGKVGEKLAKSEYGFHIIKLIEKKGEINSGLIDWVNDYKSKVKVVNYFDSAKKTKDKINSWL